MSETLTTKQVAEFLGVSVATVTQWKKKDRGPKFYRRGYGPIFYKKSEVESFGKEHNYVD